MTATSATAGTLGKSPRNCTGAKNPQIGETSISVINKIKEMYQNPAVIFGRWIGVSDKTAKRKLKLERRLTDDEIGKLIRSERGFEVLTAIMGDAKPLWWRIVVPLMDAADARRMQIAARRRMKQTIESALDADQSLTAAIRRAEALSVQDEEHVSPHLDALRSMGGVQGRPMAKGRVK